MKVKILHRSQEEHVGKAGSVTKQFRNPDPQLHPLERAREYQRALNAVKLEKIFAKPFVRAMDGHTDAVKCMTVARMSGAPLVTGSCDGELRTWSLQHLVGGNAVGNAHEGFVRGLTVSPNGSRVISCGDDKTCKMWSLTAEDYQLGEEPKATFHSASIPTSIDHHWRKPMFVTTGDTVDVWDYNRSAPLSSFEWGCERVIFARFNPAEPALIASTAVDRSVALFDLRGNTAIRKVILTMRSNAVAWNPMTPTSFVVANEDCNLYSFDMRRLDAAWERHWDHVGPVLDVDFNASGQDFVSASYDKTVRLWKYDSQRSRDVYHTKRMQRVLCCRFTPDGRFILSGSEDTNVRVWKAKSDQKLGVLTDRERHAVAYRETLKEKFSLLPEISRIKRHKHVPKIIRTMTIKRRIMREAVARKEDRRRKHTKPGTRPHVPMKKRSVVTQLE
mmetsp:Transcript_40877/g.89466  ORF Transcript_40877/g.89466 Transcript_40877/m.89466 type:complete len:446 (-) Transcript_40877:85-1422(-)|eukprot:CAMPEP_0170581694 /NCGR_PEP_ID=MMETSP0224-20130122/7179_1 /TAXON_ID=285029 /ORGANISM="Togula jolla, Strain CCCM 725" /LENGTH=445 /DNA_ID=CAMNT_0010904853 /DNA_START=83 /DNA_END=1420 /DNA_ORIENTATION=-